MNERTTPLATRLAATIPPGVTRHRADDRAAWLRMRQADVTASAIAALIGAHPYLTALGLYALKTGATADAEVEPVVTETSISLPPMLRGTVLEQVAPTMIRMFCPGWAVEPCGWYYRAEADRIGATPDFVAIDPNSDGFGIIQVKTCDGLTFKRTWCPEGGPPEPPLFIALQAIVEAVLTGAAWAAVGVMVTGSNLTLHLLRVPLHRPAMDRLRAEAARFWRAVDAGEAPPADYGRDGALLASLHAQDDGTTVDLSGDNRLPALQSLDARLAAIGKRVADKRAAIKAELLDKMGPATTATAGGVVVATAKTVHRREYVAKASSYRDVRFKRSA